MRDSITVIWCLANRMLFEQPEYEFRLGPIRICWGCRLYVAPEGLERLRLTERYNLP